MRILLVDDHAIVREGLRRILADVCDPEALVVGEASCEREALAQLRAECWDVAVLDISMPGRNGLETLKEIRRRRPRLPVLMMTMHAEEQYALRCLRAGASGYISKDSAPEELIEAIERVRTGGRYVSRTLGEHLAASLVSDAGRPLHESLSDRELQVMQMLASGMSVKEIGFALRLSDKTISTYRSRLLEKMKMRTGAQLMRYAIRAKLVD